MILSLTAQKVITKRYLQKNKAGSIVEDAQGMVARVAAHVGQTEAEREEFFRIMFDQEFLPNSPTLMNAGHPSGGCLSACFVVPIEDNISSILDGVKHAALICKAGGGVGYSFSKLREANSLVQSTHGVASGPISFMSIFDAMTETIKQGGRRRGANMGILHCQHPDIAEFISCKRHSNNLNNFNLSVALTDEFMQALKENSSYSLISPHTGEVIKNVMASEVWDLIVQNAWETGEPGIIFIDTINKANPTPHLGRIDATNPCVHGDTPLLTSGGVVSIQEKIGEEIEIWNGFEFSKVTPKLTREKQSLVKVTFSDGAFLKCTPYHQWALKDGIRVGTKDLNIGDVLLKYSFPVLAGSKVIPQKDAYTAGFFSGDGASESKRKRDSLWLYAEKRKLLPYFDYERHNKCQQDRDFVKLPTGKYHKDFVPSVEWSLQSRLNWLAGLIDADGARNDKGGGVTISSINYDFLYQVKLMLNTMGSSGTLSLMKKAIMRKMPDGKGGEKEYPTQDCYRIVISASRVKFLRNLGLRTHRVPIDCEPSRCASRFIKVTSIEEVEGLHSVYCFEERKRHLGYFNGVVSAQCGEQPLFSYESCTLGSINLAKFVDNLQINWDRLGKTVAIGVRFLDRVIDINEYPLPEIERATTYTRKIGLGVMGWADMLISLGIPYNSLKALNLAEKVMSFVNETAFRESLVLGFERGGAPCFVDIVCKQEMDMEVSTLRNATRTTIAPTGTISILAGCSSGIEPLFKMAYLRTIMDNETFIEIHPMLEAIASAKLSTAKMEKFKEELLELGEVNEEFLARFKLQDDIDAKVWISSHQIKPEWHIKMQAAFQKHVDNAVSKTINLPADATVKDVARSMEMAWKLGIKGVTVYRDGARPEQVLASASQISRRVRNRPESLIGKTDSAMTGCGTMYITQNYDDKLFEVFLQLGKAGGCETAQTESTGRLISLALRAGIEVQDIAKQLIGIRCPNPCWSKGKQFLSCFDAIGKKLADNAGIPPVELITKGALCPDCNYVLELKGGCESCPNCGFEKCK